MAVMPISPTASVPSSRGQPSDGSAADPNGFGSLLGGVDADPPDSGGTAGGARSGGSRPTPTTAAAAKPEKTAPPPADGTATKDGSAAEASDGQPAKAAGPANGATRSDGAKGHQAFAGKAHKPGKDASVADGQAADVAAAATGIAAAAPALATQTAAAPIAGDAALAGPVDQTDASAAAAALTDGAAGTGASLQAIASALSAAGAQPTISADAAAALPASSATPLTLPVAASAFGNAVLDAAMSPSPLTGNPASPPARDAAPSIAASLLAGLEPSSDGGAPAAALAPTGPGAQSVVAPPGTPMQWLAPLPEASAAPLAAGAPAGSAVPQSSIAPGIAAAASLLPITADAGRIIIQALPHGTLGNGGLHGAKGAPGNGATGLPSGSFGNALLPPGGIPGLAAALLGGTDDQPSDLADGLLQSAESELAGDAAAEKSASSDAVAPDSVAANGHDTALPVPGFNAALAHADTARPTSGTEAARNPQHPSAMPPMPAMQIMPSLTKAAGDGGGRFNIQLHPQELGRVRVELDIDHDGHVTAAISAAHPATLDLLRRDAAALQQALNDAGLKTDGNALSFNLQGDGQDMAERSGRSARAATPLVPPAVDPLEETVSQSGGSVSLGAGLVAVDIRI
jgi:flagellar hook-length control protein FliK